MSLKFSAASHRYWLDRKPVPGVTTLIKKGLPKPALVYWSARTVAEYVAHNPDNVEQLRAMGEGPMVAALKQVPWQKRDDAGIRGTEIHAIAEKIVHGEAVDVPERLVPYVEGYARFLDAFDVQPLVTEVNVASRKWFYAGRPDFIGTIGGRFEGAIVCADWKTSSNVYGDTALQTAAYARAEFYCTDDDPDTELPLPEATRLAVVHITLDETNVYDLGDIEDAYSLFLHVQYVAKQSEHLNSLIRDPEPFPELIA